MRRFGLLLDLSHAGFAAVLDDAATAVRARSARPAGTRHDDVADWTEALLREAGATFADLAWVAAGVGPGSFTGIRIAMAFAQGLALPHGVSLHGFTSFEALHLSAASGTGEGEPEQGSVLAVVPANAGRFYVSRALADPGALMTGDELAALCREARLIAAPEATPALTTLMTRLRESVEAGAAGPAPTMWTPGEHWDACAIARHAVRSGRGLERPVYLQLSAAEEKFGAAGIEAAPGPQAPAGGTP